MSLHWKIQEASGTPMVRFYLGSQSAQLKLITSKASLLMGLFFYGHKVMNKRAAKSGRKK
jgi:hypothetical protein